MNEKVASCGYFDGVAGCYETNWRWRRVRRNQSLALAALELGPGDRLLDVGCGTGAAVREAAALVSRVVGLDLSPRMIEQARELAAELDNTEFAVGDGEHLPFPDGEFTAVLCSTSIHHFPSPRAAVGEMARVLAPGGRIAIGDANPEQLVVRLVDRRLKRNEPGHLGFVHPHELVRLLRDAGCEEISLSRLHRQGFVIALARKR
ncbi:MAG: methyltransferase domain-containing protein [Gaiellaceae bacterium]|jgi:ubiquinone/menaquinone biosynthesis C-methylase UbiE